MANTSSAPQNSNGGPAAPTSGARREKSPKSYYGSLFDSDKRPSRILNALLRAIGQYIIDNVEDTSIKHITPQKLGVFYKPFPGDIDKFLLEAPSRDLSNMWTVMGYEHYLIQPNNDRYARPSLPALTPDGFVRWQVVQLLVDPTENVPVLQHAVKKWGLRNPDTGELFPPELPRSCCPTEPDRKTVEWEDRCGEELRKQAQHSRQPSYAEPYCPSPPHHPKMSPPAPEPAVPPRYVDPRRYNYVHVPPTGPPRGRSGADPESVYRGGGGPVPFTHVPPSGRGYSRRSPERERERERDRERDRAYVDPRVPGGRHARPHVRDVSPEGSRRRSFTDYHGRDRPGPREYGPHSASDPHLKSSQTTAPPPPPAASAPPSSGAASTGGAAAAAASVRPSPTHRTSNPRDDIQVESESESDTSDSDASDGPTDDESPGGTRPLPRRRVPRPRHASHPSHTADPSIQESVNKVFRDRMRPPNSGPTVVTPAPGAPMPSPRLRPTPPHGHTSSGDPRRRSQGLASKLPFIGDIFSSMVNGTGDKGPSIRRPHSHDSRYPPPRPPPPTGRRSYSEEDYSSEDDLDLRDRRRRDVRRRADHEVSLKEQERAKQERDRRREYDRDRDRDRDRDERSSRHLRRPEPPTRRTSSHADAERIRARDLYERDLRDREREYRYAAAKGRGPSPNQRRHVAAEPRYD